jgi:hypothetical protein
MVIPRLQEFQRRMDTPTFRDSPIIESPQGLPAVPMDHSRAPTRSQMAQIPVPIPQQMPMPQPGSQMAMAPQQMPMPQPGSQMAMAPQQMPIPQPGSQMAMAPQQMPIPQPGSQMAMAPPTEEKSPLREMLLKITPLIVASLGDNALKGKEFEIQKARNENQSDPMQIALSVALSGIQEFGVPALENNGIKVDSTFEEDIESGGLSGIAANDGLIEMAMGGNFRGRVPGDGHGMQDNVFMPIREETEEVGTLAVSPKEYVVDAHTMSALGNGNPDKGADVMDEVVNRVREKAYGTDQQPNEINGLAALRPMIERV